jgi:hypothetical protein
MSSAVASRSGGGERGSEAAGIRTLFVPGTIVAGMTGAMMALVLHLVLRSDRWRDAG